MATNEHFLLAYFVKTIGVIGNVARTFDEVVKGVKRERVVARRAIGKRTGSLVKKALRKLKHNDLVEFVDVKGQPGYRVTNYGISEIKRVMQDYRTCALRNTRSPIRKRARDIFHLGSFLKKRLVRDTDDLFEEMRNKYQIALEEMNRSREEMRGNEPEENLLRASSPTYRVTLCPDQLAAVPTPSARVNLPLFDRQNWNDIISDPDSSLGSMSDSETGTDLHPQPRSACYETRYPSPNFSDTQSLGTSASSKHPSSMSWGASPEADYETGTEENMSSCIDFTGQPSLHTFGGPSRKSSFDSEKTLVGSSVEDKVVFPVFAPSKQVTSTKLSHVQRRSTSNPSTGLEFSRRRRRLYKHRRRPDVHNPGDLEPMQANDMPHSARLARLRMRRRASASRAEDAASSDSGAQLSDSFRYSSEVS